MYPRYLVFALRVIAAVAVAALLQPAVLEASGCGYAIVHEAYNSVSTEHHVDMDVEVSEPDGACDPVVTGSWWTTNASSGLTFSSNPSFDREIRVHVDPAAAGGETFRLRVRIYNALTMAYIGTLSRDFAVDITGCIPLNKQCPARQLTVDVDP